jgi:zinc protease
MEIVADALTSAPSGRLPRALVESGLATSVSADVYRLRDAGMAMFNAGVRKEASLDRARDAMLAEIARLSTVPLTSEEVERARARLLKNIDLVMAESDRLAMALTESVAAGDWRLMFLNRDRIRRATVPDVQHAAAAYLKPSNRTLGLFIPEDAPSRAEIPATPPVGELVRNYSGDPSVSNGEAFDPLPANIEQRAVRRALPNGLQLIVVPKKTRGSRIVAALRMDYGDAQSLSGLAAASDAVRQMLLRGTQRRSRQQIQDDLTRLKADVAVSGSPARTQVLIRTVSASLPEVLALLMEVLRTPAFAPAEFAEMKQAALAGIESVRTDPQALAALTLQRTLNPFPSPDPRAVRTYDEQIADLSALTVDQVRDFHRRFYSLSNATLTVGGDTAAAQIERLLTPLVAGWPAAAPHARLVRPYAATAAATPVINTPDKANAILTAALLFPTSDEDPDYPALLLANYMLGGHAKSRLYDRIRGQEGLSYSVASQLAATPGEARATWTFTALTNPLNIAKVDAAFRDEIAKALTGGFADTEVEAARQGYLQGRQVARADDAAVAQRLALLAYDGRTMRFDESLEARIASLTPAQINDAVRRHLDSRRLVVLRAGDFSKTAQ